jgi:hypothetical protein
MSPHYETAAHLLLMLTRSGLEIPQSVDCRIVLGRLDHRFANLQRDAGGLSHSGAALWILDDLVRARLVRCEPNKKSRVLAILGTGIATVEHQTPKPAKPSGRRRRAMHS